MRALYVKKSKSESKLPYLSKVIQVVQVVVFGYLIGNDFSLAQITCSLGWAY